VESNAHLRRLNASLGAYPRGPPPARAKECFRHAPTSRAAGQAPVLTRGAGADTDIRVVDLTYDIVFPDGRIDRRVSPLVIPVAWSERTKWADRKRGRARRARSEPRSRASRYGR